MEQWFFPGPQRDIDAEGRVRPSPYPTLYSHHCSQLPATENGHFLDTGRITSHNSRQDLTNWINLNINLKITPCSKYTALETGFLIWPVDVWGGGFPGRRIFHANVFSGFPYKIVPRPFGSVQCFLGHVGFPCGPHYPTVEQINVSLKTPPKDKIPLTTTLT